MIKICVLEDLLNFMYCNELYFSKTLYLNFFKYLFESDCEQAYYTQYYKFQPISRIRNRTSHQIHFRIDNMEQIYIVNDRATFQNLIDSSEVTRVV